MAILHLFGKKMNLKLLLVVLVCPITTSLVAQKKIYTLEEVWKKVAVYPSVNSKEEIVKREQALKQLVIKEGFPEVNIQAQQTYGNYASVAGAFFPLPGIYNTSGTKPANELQHGSNMFTSASFQWDILQFGRQRKNIEVADSRIKLSQAAMSEETFRLQILSTRYYFGMLESASLLAHLKGDSKRLSDLLELQRAQVIAGLRPGADSLLILSAYLDAVSRQADQEVVLTTLTEQLSSLIGENSSAVALDTSIYQRFSDGSYLSGEQRTNHPYLVSLEAAIQQQSAELSAVKREPYPSIGILAGTGIRGSGLGENGEVNKNLSAPWNNNASTYLVGVGVTWNFSSLYKNRQKQNAAFHEVEAAKSDYKAADRQLQASYAAAVASWKEQKIKKQNARLSLHASQQAYDLYTVRYESGLINLIELLQLQKNLRDAEITYVRSVSAFWSSLIQQSESFGDPSLLLTAIKQ